MPMQTQRVVRDDATMSVRLGRTLLLGLVMGAVCKLHHGRGPRLSVVLAHVGIGVGLV